MENVNVEIGADITGLRKGLAQGRDDIKGFQERIKSDTAVELSLKVAKFKTDLDEIKRQMKQDIPPAMTIELKAKSELLQRDITQAGRELTNFLRTGDTGVSVLGKNFQGLGGTMKSVMSSIGSAFAGVFAVSTVVDFFASATAEAKKFGEAINRVRTVSGASKAELAGLKDNIKDLSNELGLSSQSLADASFEIASAGIAVKDIPGVLETVGKMAVASGTDMTTAFNGVYAVLQGYGMGIEKATAVSDLFFTANAQGKVHVEGLAREIGSVAPIAQASGVSIQELIAGFSTLTGVTGTEAEVATQLKGVIQALGAPTAEASKAFKALGVDVGQNAIEQKGLVGVLKDVYNASGGNMEIMRKFIPEVTALSAVQALATTQTERYSQNLDGLANSFGSTEKALQLYTDSEEFKLQQSQMIWDNWKLGVGESTVGVMASLIELGGFFSKWLNMLSKLIGMGFGLLLTGLTFGLEIVYNVWKNVFSNFTKIFTNIAKIAQNIGTIMGGSMDDMPNAIQNALATSLQKVEAFFTSVLKGWNDFTKKIGADALSISDTSINLGSKALGGGNKAVKGSIKSITQGTEDFQLNPFAGNYDFTKKLVGAEERSAVELDQLYRGYGVGAKKSAGDTAKDQVIEEKRKKNAQELEEARKQAEAIKKAIADANKKPTGGGADKEAKKELDAHKKLLEDKATADVKATQASTLTEVQKAKRIVEINDKLKTDLQLLDGKYLDVQAKNAQELLKQSEEDTKKLKATKSDAYDDIVKQEKQNLSDVEKLGNAYGDLAKKLKDVGTQGAEDIKKITDEITALEKKLKDVQGTGQKDLAGRGIDAQKELQAIKDKQALGNGITPEELQKRFDLEKEIELINSSTTPQERADALNESLKSKAQLILDQIKIDSDKIKQDIADADERKKIKEADIALEQKGIKDKMDAIALQITTETQTMITEDVKRRKLESEYTTFFGEEIAKRTDSVKGLMEAVANAKIALESVGITQTVADSSKGNTTANSTVFNITNGNDVDAESFLRALNNKLPTK